MTAAVLVSTAASAQVQVSLTFANATDTLSVGKGDCNSRRVVSWTSTGTACQELTLWLTEGTECKETADQQTTRSVLTSIPQTTLNQTRQGTFEIDLSLLPFSNPTDSGTRSCGVGGLEQAFRVCGATKAIDSNVFGGTTCANSVTKATPAKILYDANPPGAPSIEAVDGLDKALRVSVSEPAGTTTLKVYVKLADGTVVTSADQGVGQGDFEVEDLENGVTYQLTATALDAAGNESSESEAVEGTPTKTNGFLEEYVNAGGKEMGGCGAAGGGVAGGAVLAVLGFWLFSRRNRSWLEQ
jgi:uncharacterized protein (TIGR03382 family)